MFQKQITKTSMISCVFEFKESQTGAYMRSKMVAYADIMRKKTAVGAYTSALSAFSKGAWNGNTAEKA